MTYPTVIRVTTKTGPPGIGLPAGSAQQDGFAVVKDGASPYLYKLVEISQVGLPQALGITASPTFAGLTLSGLQAQAQGLAVVGINGQIQRASIGSGLAIQNGALVVTISGGGSGTVTSVGLSAPTGFSVSNSPVTGSGVLSFSFADGYIPLTTAKQQQWDAGAGLAATAIQGDDARLTNSREWSAETISKAEAEEGTSTTRRAFSSLRVRENVSAWWQAVSGATGKLLAAANTQADARTALGLGTAATSATTDFATPSALATGLAGKADLVGGVIPSSQIPSIAISAYLGAVGSQSAMLSLSGEVGDWCIRIDGLPNTGAWILSGNDPSSLSNWVKIPLPDVPVQSVNGQAGNIVLSPSDIGAATAAQGAKADSAIQPGNSALSDAREWSASTIDEAEAAAGTATTRRAFNALRVRQAILGWWQTVASTVGQSLVGAADTQTARNTIGAAASGAITSSGLTMATARILARFTAGTGVVEETPLSPGFVVADGILYHEQWLAFALAARTSDAATGTNVNGTAIPYKAQLLAVQLDLSEAPAGANFVVDLNKGVGGASVLSTKLSIDAGETNSATAAIPAVISDNAIPANTYLSWDIDQVGATAGSRGKGPVAKVLLRRVA